MRGNPRTDAPYLATTTTWKGRAECIGRPCGRRLVCNIPIQEKVMSNRLGLLAATTAIALAPGVALPLTSFGAMEKTVQVGGAPMYPSKNIIQNAVNSKDHTTLVAAVKAAGLVDTLEGAEPFTAFAPTNRALARCPKGTVA